MTADPPPVAEPPDDADAFVLTPPTFAAGWLGVLSPALAWGTAASLLRGPPTQWQGILLAVAAMGLFVAWPATCAGAATARLVRRRRHSPWSLPWTDAVGAFAGGTLLTIGFVLCTWIIAAWAG